MPRRLQFVAPILIILVGALVYWQGLHGGFIFDDFPNLVDDPDWKVTTLDLLQWRRAMDLGIASDYGRPLAMLSFAVNHYFTGLDPYWLKLTNLAFHLLNGILVFFLCRQVFAAITSRASQQSSEISALVIAMAWVLHPLQVSSVLYVVQRMEVSAHTWVLLALICYLRARQNQQEGKRGSPWFALSVMAAFIGLGFKESAALVPAYALALEVAILRFRTTGTRSSPWLSGIWMAGLAAVLAIYLFHILPIYLAPGAYGFRPFTVTERLIAQLHVLTMYLGQAVMPVPSTLLFFYDNFPIQHSLPSSLAKLAILAGLLCFAALAHRRLPVFTLGILWFFIAHALTSNVVPLELAFEHRNYFALLGVLLAAAEILTALLSKATSGTRPVLAIVLIAFFTFLTAIQVNTWAEPLRLATSLASRNPDSYRASFELGAQLFRTAGDNPDSPLLSLAAKEFEHASSLPLSSPIPEQALIYLNALLGKKAPPDVWFRFREKLAKRPAGPEEIAALNGVLQCRLSGACRHDDQELLSTFFVALNRNPDSPTILSLYATFAFNVLGDTELAIQVARESIRLEPSKLEYQIGLARILGASGLGREELPGLVESIHDLDIYDRYSAEVARDFEPPDRGEQ